MLQAGMDPGYVLDRMEPYEIDAIFRNIHLKHKEDWERTRLAAFVTAQTNCSKKLNYNQFLKFPWEEKKGRVSSPISDEDMARLRAKAKEMIEKGIVTL